LVGVVFGSGEDHRVHKLASQSGAELLIKPDAQGVHVGQRLSFGAAGKGLQRTVAKVANRTREIRPSGMKTGA
jgi:hypothetical protein